MHFVSGDAERVKKQLESVEDRMERYEEYFTVSIEALKEMTNQFYDELTNGLRVYQANKRMHARGGSSPTPYAGSSCFKMLDSCIVDLPNGKETGIYYGLDFGGSNFRAVEVNLLGNGNLSMKEVKKGIADVYVESGNLITDEATTASEMFDFFANAVKSLMEKNPNIDKEKFVRLNKKVLAGFTFSFPCVQRKLESAYLLEWTKGYETGRKTNDPVEGSDVALLMDVSFERNKVPVKVAAVINDTVGALLSASYTLDYSKCPPCVVGVILGTGVNACYVEPSAEDYGYKGVIVNIECGSFDRALPKTNVDHEIDYAAVANRGKQQLEKMLSGGYVAEIVRRTFVKVLQKRAPSLSWVPFSLRSEFCAEILNSEEGKCQRTVVALLKELWEFSEVTASEAEMFTRITKVVFKRSAALAAVIIAATAKKSGRLQAAMGGLTVAVDGSLYKGVRMYREELRGRLEEILGKERSSLIHIITSDDGSGKGAAILAGAVEKRH